MKKIPGFLLAGAAAAVVVVAGSYATAVRKTVPATPAAVKEAPQADGRKPAATNAGELKWLSYDEAAPLAARAHKPMLVDVFTTWCGWCKRMDATTYKDPRVIAALNESFVLVRLNAESDRTITYRKQSTTERDVSRYAWGVSGYPTTIFLKSDGEVIAPLPGYVPAADFHTVLRYIGTGAYEKMKFEEFQKKAS